MLCLAIATAGSGAGLCQTSCHIMPGFIPGVGPFSSITLFNNNTVQTQTHFIAHCTHSQSMLSGVTVFGESLLKFGRQQIFWKLPEIGILLVVHVQLL